jgi:hypothetical protein
MTCCYKGRAAAFFLPLLLVLVGCSQNQNPQASGASSGGASATADTPGVLGRIFESTRSEAVPEGTVLDVVLNQTISSGDSRSGDSFEATLATPIEVDGKVVIPDHAVVRGHVAEVEGSGRLKGVAHLDLTLDSLEANGTSYALETSHVIRSGENHNKRNGELIGGGAGLGAIIGGIAGGGKGALIGGAAGAGAGTGTAAYTGKKDIRIPAETQLSFRLSRPLTITVKD